MHLFKYLILLPATLMASGICFSAENVSSFEKCVYDAWFEECYKNLSSIEEEWVKEAAFFVLDLVLPDSDLERDNSIICMNDFEVRINDAKKYEISFSGTKLNRSGERSNYTVSFDLNKPNEVPALASSALISDLISSEDLEDNSVPTKEVNLKNDSALDLGEIIDGQDLQDNEVLSSNYITKQYFTIKDSRYVNKIKRESVRSNNLDYTNKCFIISNKVSKGIEPEKNERSDHIFFKMSSYRCRILHKVLSRLKITYGPQTSVLFIGYFSKYSQKKFVDAQPCITGTLGPDERPVDGALREIQEELGVTVPYSNIENQNLFDNLHYYFVCSAHECSQLGWEQKAAALRKKNEVDSQIEKIRKRERQKVAVAIFGSNDDLRRLMAVAQPIDIEENIGYLSIVPIKEAIKGVLDQPKPKPKWK